MLRPDITPTRGGTVRDYLGIDWADGEDMVWGADEAGAKVVSQRIAHTVAARSAWARWLRERQAEGLELWAALERPHGRLVDFLLAHGIVVYAINPKSLDRARDRYRVGASKSDPFDAQVLALFLRSDQAALRPLRPSSEGAQELQGLTRDYRRQVHLKTRLLNQLTATLKEYYPRALELSEDLDAQWVQAFLVIVNIPGAVPDADGPRRVGKSLPRRGRGGNSDPLASRRTAERARARVGKFAVKKFALFK
jgi:Transposase